MKQMIYRFVLSGDSSKDQVILFIFFMGISSLSKSGVKAACKWAWAQSMKERFIDVLKSFQRSEDS